MRASPTVGRTRNASRTTRTTGEGGGVSPSYLKTGALRGKLNRGRRYPSPRNSQHGTRSGILATATTTITDDCRCTASASTRLAHSGHTDSRGTPSVAPAAATAATAAACHPLVAGAKAVPSRRFFFCSSCRPYPFLPPLPRRAADWRRRGWIRGRRTMRLGCSVLIRRHRHRRRSRRRDIFVLLVNTNKSAASSGTACSGSGKASSGTAGSSSSSSSRTGDEGDPVGLHRSSHVLEDPRSFLPIGQNYPRSQLQKKKDASRCDTEKKKNRRQQQKRTPPLRGEKFNTMRDTTFFWRESNNHILLGLFCFEKRLFT